MMGGLLIGYDDAAQLLGVAKSTLYSWTSKGVLSKNCYLGHGLFNRAKIEYHVDRGSLFKDRPSKVSDNYYIESVQESVAMRKVTGV